MLKMKDRKRTFLGPVSEYGQEFKIVAKTWSELLSDLEDVGLKIDSAYRRLPSDVRFRDKYFPFYDENGRCWMVEPTQYSNGEWEVQSYNIHEDYSDDWNDYDVEECYDINAASAGPVRLHVEWYPYERYGGGGSKRKANFSADNMMEALAKLADHLGLYIQPDEILGDDDYPAEYDSPEEVIESIENSNGDGCDYITLLQNKTTGEILIQGWDEEEEEDWD